MAMETVTLRYFAAIAAAAGVDEEKATLNGASTVADVLGDAARRHGAEFERVLGLCSLLHNTVAVHDRSARLAGGDTLDVLPPFAGG